MRIEAFYRALNEAKVQAPRRCSFPSDSKRLIAQIHPDTRDSARRQIEQLPAIQTAQIQDGLVCALQNQFSNLGEALDLFMPAEDLIFGADATSHGLVVRLIGVR